MEAFLVTLGVLLVLIFPAILQATRSPAKKKRGIPQKHPDRVLALKEEESETLVTGYEVNQ